jgi:hypothetical protein
VPPGPQRLATFAHAPRQRLTEPLFRLPPAGPDPEIDVVSTREPRTRRSISAWTLGSAGAAVALGIGSAVASAVAGSDRNDYLMTFEEEGRYDRDVAESAERGAIVSNLMLGAAFASAGLAAYLHFTGEAADDDEASVRLLPSLGADTPGVALVIGVP